MRRTAAGDVTYLLIELKLAVGGQRALARQGRRAWGFTGSPSCNADKTSSLSPWATLGQHIHDDFKASPGNRGRVKVRLTNLFANGFDRSPERKLRSRMSHSSHNNNNNIVEFTLATGLARLHCGLREGDWRVVGTDILNGSYDLGRPVVPHLGRGWSIQSVETAL